MKLFRALPLLILMTGCSTGASPPAQLPQCWNVNDITSGKVAGEGLFVRHMHGLSLQAPGCSDRAGQNSYQIRSPANRSIRDYLAAEQVPSRFIGFKFRGTVESAAGGKELRIEEITGLRSVGKPRWMTGLEVRLQ